MCILCMRNEDELGNLPAAIPSCSTTSPGRRFCSRLSASYSAMDEATTWASTACTSEREWSEQRGTFLLWFGSPRRPPNGPPVRLCAFAIEAFSPAARDSGLPFPSLNCTPLHAAQGTDYSGKYSRKQYFAFGEAQCQDRLDVLADKEARAFFLLREIISDRTSRPIKVRR